jgi:hypothetical protein
MCEDRHYFGDIMRSYIIGRFVTMQSDEGSVGLYVRCVRARQ